MRGMFVYDELPRSCEVVVIGGGIVGTACADALARRGIPVLLIERDQIASGASGACEGNILLSDKEPGPALELGRAGQALYRDLAQRLPLDIELEQKGALVLSSTAESLARTAAYAQRMQAAGVAAQMVTITEAQELEPALSPTLIGGAFFPDDLQVWPMKVVFALALSAHAAGAKIVCNTNVEAIQLSGDTVTGVRTSRGTVTCKTVVVAAGIGSGPLLAACGLQLPLATRKGQIVVTEPCPGLIRRKLFDASYTDTVHAAGAGLQVSTVLETTRRGNVLIGSSRDVSDAESSARLAVSAALVRCAVRFVPALSQVRAIRSYTGFRPALPDALPAIGRTAAAAGLIVATGHEGAGIHLGPITGEIVAQLYSGEIPRVDIQPFDPDRFPAEPHPSAPVEPIVAEGGTVNRERR